MVLRFDARPGEVFVAAGSPRADWCQNIQAAPAVEVAVGSRRYRPVQRFLPAGEIAELLIWSLGGVAFRPAVTSGAGRRKENARGRYGPGRADVFTGPPGERG